MAKERSGGLSKIGREIGKEAARQLRGFPDEFRSQLTGAWGKEFAKQIFGGGHRTRRPR